MKKRTEIRLNQAVMNQLTEVEIRYRLVARYFPKHPWSGKPDILIAGDDAAVNISGLIFYPGFPVGLVRWNNVEKSNPSNIISIRGIIFYDCQLFGRLEGELYRLAAKQQVLKIIVSDQSFRKIWRSVQEGRRKRG